MYGGNGKSFQIVWYPMCTLPLVFLSYFAIALAGDEDSSDNGLFYDYSNPENLGDIPIAPSTSAPTLTLEASQLQTQSADVNLLSGTATVLSDDELVVVAVLGEEIAKITRKEGHITDKKDRLTAYSDHLGYIKDKKSHEINALSREQHDIAIEMARLTKITTHLSDKSDEMTRLGDDIKHDIDEITFEQDEITLEIDDMTRESDKISEELSNIALEVSAISLKIAIYTRDSAYFSRQSTYYSQQSARFTAAIPTK